MFTIKLYSSNGYRQRILEAESFTILRGGDDGGAEITLHQKNGAEDNRYDIGDDGKLIRGRKKAHPVQPTIASPAHSA